MIHPETAQECAGDLMGFVQWQAKQRGITVTELLALHWGWILRYLVQEGAVDFPGLRRTLDEMESFDD